MNVALIFSLVLYVVHISARDQKSFFSTSSSKNESFTLPPYQPPLLQLSQYNAVRVNPVNDATALYYNEATGLPFQPLIMKLSDDERRYMDFLQKYAVPAFSEEGSSDSDLTSILPLVQLIPDDSLDRISYAVETTSETTVKEKSKLRALLIYLKNLKLKPFKYVANVGNSLVQNKKKNIIEYLMQSPTALPPTHVQPVCQYPYVYSIQQLDPSNYVNTKQQSFRNLLDLSQYQSHVPVQSQHPQFSWSHYVSPSTPAAGASSQPLRRQSQFDFQSQTQYSKLENANFHPKQGATAQFPVLTSLDETTGSSKKKFSDFLLAPMSPQVMLAMPAVPAPTTAAAAAAAATALSTAFPSTFNSGMYQHQFSNQIRSSVPYHQLTANRLVIPSGNTYTYQSSDLLTAGSEESAISNLKSNQAAPTTKHDELSTAEPIRAEPTSNDTILKQPSTPILDNISTDVSSSSVTSEY